MQPSRFEGNAVTVREAQMLGKPVVVTSYPTACNQVVDGEDAIIVPIDNAACADGIASFITNTGVHDMISSNLLLLDRTNNTAMEKFYSLI